MNENCVVLFQNQYYHQPQKQHFCQRRAGPTEKTRTVESKIKNRAVWIGESEIKTIVNAASKRRPGGFNANEWTARMKIATYDKVEPKAANYLAELQRRWGWANPNAELSVESIKRSFAKRYALKELRLAIVNAIKTYLIGLAAWAIVCLLGIGMNPLKFLQWAGGIWSFVLVANVGPSTLRRAGYAAVGHG